jgi:hypothetical protein
MSETIWGCTMSSPATYSSRRRHDSPPWRHRPRPRSRTCERTYHFSPTTHRHRIGLNNPAHPVPMVKGYNELSLIFYELLMKNNCLQLSFSRQCVSLFFSPNMFLINIFAVISCMWGQYSALNHVLCNKCCLRAQLNCSLSRVFHYFTHVLP